MPMPWKRAGTRARGSRNLGTRRGVGVLRLDLPFERASGRAVPYEIVARRAGDVAEVL